MPNTDTKQFAVFVGVDWADQKHDYCAFSESGTKKGQVVHQIDKLDEWIEDLQQLAQGKPIAIAVEQKRGPLFNALTSRSNITLFPIDPGKFASYRKSFTKDAKTDQNDALYLAKMLRERWQSLTPTKEVDPRALKIHETAMLRRKTVDQRTAILLKLQAEVKSHFPLVLELFRTVTNQAALQILKRWPTQRKLKRANPRTIRLALRDGGIRNPQKQTELIRLIRESKLFCQQAEFAESHDIQVKLFVSQYHLLSQTISEYDERLQNLIEDHPDAHLFLGIRGVGPVIAARLIAAFETEAANCPTADHLCARAGISPAPNSSGKNAGKRHVARVACNRYLKQTFHEFVDSARHWCVWTKARYKQLRAGKMKHNAAIRKIARSWIRILFRMWHTKQPFDAERYLNQILVNNPELQFFVTEQIPKRST